MKIFGDFFFFHVAAGAARAIIKYRVTERNNKVEHKMETTKQNLEAATKRGQKRAAKLVAMKSRRSQPKLPAVK